MYHHELKSIWNSVFPQGFICCYEIIEIISHSIAQMNQIRWAQPAIPKRFIHIQIIASYGHSLVRAKNDDIQSLPKSNQLIEIFNTEFALSFAVLLSLKAQADDFRKYRHGNTELYAGVSARAAQKFFISRGKMSFFLSSSRLWSMTAYKKISESTAMRIVFSHRKLSEFFLPLLPLLLRLRPKPLYRINPWLLRVAEGPSRSQRVDQMEFLAF
jgi:hypothetical protein